MSGEGKCDPLNREYNRKQDEPESNISQLGMDNALDDLVKSDSKAPLKTPVKDEDPDVQVKLFVSESLNGKGKCMAEDAIASFSGLSKEELLKYANDPFWIRMRLLLFVFFWVVWIAMFVGAITIIVLAPKCEPPKPPEWYEQGPLYEMDVEKFVGPEKSVSLLQGLKSKLEYLSDLKIKGVILSPLFKTDEKKEDSVLDFKSLDERFGSLDDFKELIEKSEEKNINVILSFVPNHSSNKHVWFNKSVAREVPYKDYYIWAPPSGVTVNGSKTPPNNWLSVKGESAWEWVEERQEFYLHQFDVDQPDLNYRNPHVLEELKNIFIHWIKLGVKGFNLDRVQYLLEDEDLQNEVANGKPGAIHTNYDFYSHTKTHSIPEVGNILTSWRQIIKENTEEKGVLIITGDVPIPSDSNSTTVFVDISRNEKLLKNLEINFSAKDLYSNVARIVKSERNRSAVQLGNRYQKRVSDSFGEKNVDGLNMISLLLPATPIIYFGEELGLSEKTPFTWGDEENGVDSQKKTNESHYKVFKALVTARDTQTVLYGETNLKVVNDSVFVLTRVNLGNPGYLMAYNPSPNDITVDLSNLDYVPHDLMIYTKSIHSNLNISTGQDKIRSSNVFLESKAAAVFTFAPKTEE